MKILNSFICLILIILTVSCSKDEKISVVKEKNIETQMIEAFEEGYKELENETFYLLRKNLMKLNFSIHNLNGHLEQL